MSASQSALAKLLDLEAIRAELAERKLREFIRIAWRIIEPGTPFLDNWHIDAIAEHLEAVTIGQITRLLINLPPRHMKSIEVSIMWPCWEWVQIPEQRWLFASYSAGLSTEHSLKRRDIIESDWYQRHWGDRFRLVTDQNVKTEFKNSRQGVMFATSTTGTATGKGGNRLVVDDPHDPLQAESNQIRESQIQAFDRKLSTRLNDKKKGAIVVVMQRLHEKDLSGHLLKQGGYVHLCLPAVAEQRTVISLPLSGRTIVREQGELLWPEREGPKELEDAKRQLGPYGYAGQYQQRPAPAGGSRFRSEWFRYCRREGDRWALLNADGSLRKLVSIEDCIRFCIMDPAGTEKEQNAKACYTVIQTWDMTPDFELILVDQFRQQVETPDAVDNAVRIVRRDEADFIGVEKDGLGLGVVQTIRRKGITVRPIKARGSKEARSETAEIRMAAGLIYFAMGAAWLPELESELLLFPNSEFKDQVDALAHAAIHAHRMAGGLPRNDEDDAIEKERAEREAAEQEATVNRMQQRRDQSDLLNDEDAWDEV